MKQWQAPAGGGCSYNRKNIQAVKRTRTRGTTAGRRLAEHEREQREQAAALKCSSSGAMVASQTDMRVGQRGAS